MCRRTFLSSSTIFSLSLSGCAKPRTTEQETIFPRGEWNRSENNPHIKGFEPTHNQAGFGGVLNAGNVVENPIDRWYFYWSGHDGGGIWISTAPKLKRPYTRQQMIFDADEIGGGDHISSPFPIVLPSGEIQLYYRRAHERAGQFR